MALRECRNSKPAQGADGTMVGYAFEEFVFERKGKRKNFFLEHLNYSNGLEFIGRTTDWQFI